MKLESNFTELLLPYLSRFEDKIFRIENTLDTMEKHLNKMSDKGAIMRMLVDNPHIKAQEKWIRYFMEHIIIKYKPEPDEKAEDYQSRIPLMPGKFGVPFRTGVWEERNKINVSILALDANGKLTTQSTSALKQNIAEYLADFRMINDYVTIKNGKVFNLGFEIDVFVDKSVPKGDIISGVINSVKNYFDINKWDMGNNIYISQ